MANPHNLVEGLHRRVDAVSSFTQLWNGMLNKHIWVWCSGVYILLATWCTTVAKLDGFWYRHWTVTFMAKAWNVRPTKQLYTGATDLIRSCCAFIFTLNPGLNLENMMHQNTNWEMEGNVQNSRSYQSTLWHEQHNATITTWDQWQKKRPCPITQITPQHSAIICVI